MKKISRSWARASIVLTVLFVLLMGVGGALRSPVPILIGTALFFAALIIKYALLRCPKCGVGGVPPQWSKSGTIHCPKCGGLYEYDK